MFGRFPRYPCFENPYPMDLHESPVTCVQYYADCPSDLIPHLYSAGSNSLNRKKQLYSKKVSLVHRQTDRLIADYGITQRSVVEWEQGFFKYTEDWDDGSFLVVESSVFLLHM